MKIGPHELDNALILAPMVGVTDVTFRKLCRRLGAGYTVSEMLTANTQLWNSDKSRLRRIHLDEPSPRSVQIVGSDPKQLAYAAKLNADHGADIIDINMGCPAKKVCKVAAGSALLANEPLVAEILASVVAAVDVPVTLKIRTGSDPDHRNGVRIAQIAEDSGIQMLAVHGRTRACRFFGEAEYETIRLIKQHVSIPVAANGDITSPQKAKKVLAFTNADAIMLGRAAQGRPWLFREVDHYLKYNNLLDSPPLSEVSAIMLDHLDSLYSLYGKEKGVLIARKHIGWYLDNLVNGHDFKKKVFAATDADSQFDMVKIFMQCEVTHMEKVA